MTLVGLCVAVFVLQTIVPGVSYDIAFVPAAGPQEPWRFLTAAFAHEGVMHILFNMMALWQIGGSLEQALGRWRFLALYVVSACAGSVGYLLLSSPPSALSPAGTNWTTMTVGASGAVFGLFGAYLVLARAAGLSLQPMLALLGLNVVLGFMMPRIAWQAHLGGFVAGLVVASIFVGLRARERQRMQWPAVALVIVVLVAVTVLKYASVPIVGGV